MKFLRVPEGSGRGEVLVPEGIRKGKHRVGTSVAGGGPRVWNGGICLEGIKKIVFGRCLLGGHLETILGLFLKIVEIL